jgi:hypothetical protein
MEAASVQRSNDPLKKALTHGLGLWAVLAPLFVLSLAALRGRFALDFHLAFLPAAHAVVHAGTPYSAAGSPALAEGTGYLYPPLAAYLLAPFTALPTVPAEILAVALAAAAVPTTLLILGVRDWRCHALAFLWWPTIVGIQTANVTLPLLVGVALVFRYRDRKLVSALAAAVVVAVKLLFWPLILWFVATRRYRTAVLAAAASALLVVVPWAGIGFAGLRGYPDLLSSVSRHEGPNSYSVAALTHAFGPSWTAATAVEAAAGVAVLVAMLVAGRRGRERDAFALAIVATLVLSPLLEMHYLSALLVVVALYRRRLAAAWFVPLLFWGAPATTAGSTIQVVHVLVVAAATVVLAASDRPAKALKRVVEREGRLSKWLASPIRRGAGPSPTPP